MIFLEVPVWDDGIGEYITRKVSVVGCLAQIGDDASDSQFRLYLSEIGHEGKLRSLGVDSIDNEYLPGLKSLALNSLRHAKSQCVDKQRLQRRY